jgi:hypothetical protein
MFLVGHEIDLYNPHWDLDPPIFTFAATPHAVMYAIAPS